MGRKEIVKTFKTRSTAERFAEKQRKRGNSRIVVEPEIRLKQGVYHSVKEHPLHEREYRKAQNIFNVCAYLKDGERLK